MNLTGSMLVRWSTPASLVYNDGSVYRDAVVIVALEAVLWALAGLGALVYYKPRIRLRSDRKALAASRDRIAQLERDVGLHDDSFDRRLEEAIGPQFHSLSEAYPLAFMEAWQRAQLRTALHPSEVEIWHAPEYPPVRVKPGWIKALDEARAAPGFPSSSS